MYRKTAIIFVSIIVLGLSGCISWVEVDAPVQKKLYSIQIPRNWLVINYNQNQLTASRNGSLLESVDVNFIAYKNMLPNTDRELSQEMLALEIVEAIITDLKANDNLFEVELVSSSPREKNGKPGYRLEATYKTEDGLRMGRIEDGYLTDKGVIRAIYQAPLRHYFETYRKEAVWMMDSLQIK